MRNCVGCTIVLLVVGVAQRSGAQSVGRDSTRTMIEVKVTRDGPPAVFAVSWVSNDEGAFLPGQYFGFGGRQVSEGRFILADVMRRGIRVREAWFTPWRRSGTRSFKPAVLLIRTGSDGVPSGLYRRARDFADLVVVHNPTRVLHVLHDERVEHFELVEEPPGWR